MKWIIAASLITLLLCSASGANAQTSAATPAPAAAAASSDKIDPRMDIKHMTDAQREQFVLTAMSQVSASMTPAVMAQNKDIYEKMKPDLQMKMAEQFALQMQKDSDYKDKVLNKLSQ